MSVIELERQGSVWVFTPKAGNAPLAAIRVQWAKYDEIPDPTNIGSWLVSFGELFGFADAGFEIEENGVVLWEYGPPQLYDVDEAGAE